MGWIVLTVILGIVALILFGLAIFVGGKGKDRDYYGPKAGWFGVFGVAAVVVWVFITAAYSIQQVPAGHVILLYQFGSIVEQRGEGFQTIAPWQVAVTASVQTQRHQFLKLSAFSKETQDVFADVTLNYSVSPEAVQTLYRTVGPGWFDVLIPPRMLNFFKEETVRYSSVDIAPNREAIRMAVKERLAQDLQQFSVSVQDLLIDNMDFLPEFKTAIELKQIATQNALAEFERIKQKANEAQQKIETARGDAESVRINAQGQADANKLLSASLTPELIQFQALQKLAPNIQIALLPSGQGLIIDPATLLGKK